MRLSPIHLISVSSPPLTGKWFGSWRGLAFLSRAMERTENVVLPGPLGVGKTHRAIALAVKATEGGHRVLFMSLDKLMTTLKKAQLENRLERQMQLLTCPRLLVLDEIGHPEGHICPSPNTP